MQVLKFEAPPAVAIIGAGVAGLAAARLLTASGVACTLFDKSRGLGGRLATRRVGALEFDHGAQFFTARGARFAALVEAWRSAGLAAEWFDGAFVGVPRMTAVAHALAEPHTVMTSRHVSRLERGGAGWTVHDDGGPIQTPFNGRFAAVILALPAPQAGPLAATAGVTFDALGEAVYAPCWTLMLAFDRTIDLPGLPLRPDGGPAAWIAGAAAKPGRDPRSGTVVLQASGAWSRHHLEQPADTVVRDLTEAFAAATGIGAAPTFAAAHRWRYALVESAVGRPCLWNPGERIGACGDWALGPRVECAFDSGEALARAVLVSLEVEHVVAAG